MPIYKKRNNIRCTLIIYMYVHAIDCCYDDCADFKSLKMGEFNQSLALLLSSLSLLLLMSRDLWCVFLCFRFGRLDTFIFWNR